jgi:hypothetical protein
MTPKEKAIELYNKFLNPSGDTYLYGMLEHESAKECALIAVDEILELKETQEEYQIQYDNGEWSRELGYRYSKYWQEVKQEIEKL